MPALSVALLPSEKLLPVQVAHAERLFAAHGVDVAVEILSGAEARDEAVAARRFDAYLVNLVSLVLYRLAGEDLQAVRTLLRSRASHPLFRLLARPGGTLPAHTLEPGARLGISRGTIVEFATFYLLRALGMVPDDFQVVEVPDIAGRSAMLVRGELSYATLPEPMASSALAQGAREIIADSVIPALPPPVLAVHTRVLETRTDEVRRLLAAIDEAAGRINEDPERYRELLAPGGPVPAAYLVPRFPVGELPERTDLTPILDWLLETQPGAAALADTGHFFEQICAASFAGKHSGELQDYIR